ncbi:TerC family protein [Xanthovirga aplysinae]|uniref:TerC family protein n=1 Tax=Xanthovirga aplysinae TaxID=2529853 RepID=UPI0012BC50FB|nr:TerC family protein [Xanthovirga aplysinae]MTI31522.1 TerC family protein [Xanthovirga aplysinae]
MEIFLQTETWIALLTLTFLEIVLGVDNIIFISIVSSKLPQHQQAKSRNVGLLLALVFRILLLMGITYIIGFTKPLVTLLDFELSGRDLILAVGGLFLLFKSTTEIHHKMEQKGEAEKNGKKHTMFAVIMQIIVLDIVFSFDSILTAVGLTDQLLIMIIAVIISLMVMMAFSGKISDFINKHPTLQMLALSFLILIGFMLIVEGLHYHVPKGYIYFAVFFSLIVEILNIRMRKNYAPVKLHKRMGEEEESGE